MVGTTRMSSKGQVVIPEEIRDQLGLRTGTRFVVVAEGDVVILRAITPPPVGDFDRLIAAAQQAAQQAGMKESDVKTAVSQVRRRRSEKRGQG